MRVVSVNKLTIEDLGHLQNTAACLDAKRQLRAPLLTAFDIYKSNVIYGVEEEVATTRKEILAWYQGLLDLEMWALQNIPTVISRYMRG